jgi:predicted methyltransferase
MSCYILSRVQAQPLLDARRSGAERVVSSLDLNMSTLELSLTDDGVALPDGSTLTWPLVKRIAGKDDNCFAIENGEATAITRFSHAFNRSYTLRATIAAPTLLIAGFPMHRIKDTTPDKDTVTKVGAALGRINGRGRPSHSRTAEPAAMAFCGRVLDTATGLGYTAALAASAGAQVTTVELDPVVLTIARYNAWSAGLFDNPRIEQMIGSSFEVIQGFPDGAFHVVLHDPPTFSLAGELYSELFYRQVHRVLRPGGCFFHYVGDLDSRSGRVVSKGVVRRMQAAGFKRVERHHEAFALVTHK